MRECESAELCFSSIVGSEDYLAAGAARGSTELAQLEIQHRLMATLLDRLQTERSIAVQEQNLAALLPPLLVDSVFLRFFLWFYHEPAEAQATSECQACFHMLVEPTCRRTAQSVQQRELPVDLVTVCLRDPRLLDLLGLVWTAQSFDSAQVIRQLRDTNTLIAARWQDLDRLAAVHSEFLPETGLAATVAHLRGVWPTLCRAQLEHQFAIEPVPGPGIDGAEPFAPELMASLPWLSRLTQSDLFQLFWNRARAEHATLAAQIESAASAWSQLYQRIDKREAQMKDLQPHLALLLLRSEWDMFTRTATQQMAVVFFDATWDGLLNMLRKCQHFLSLVADDTLTQVRRVLELIQINCIQEEGHAGVMEVRRAAGRLAQYLATLDVGQVTIAEFMQTPELEATASTLDPELLRVDPTLLEAVCQARDLFNWLRTMPNDTDFTASLEMAMGRRFFFFFFLKKIERKKKRKR